MSELPKPPPRCTPATFYGDYVPAFWRALDLPARAHPALAIEVRVDAEVFSLTVENGTLIAAPHPAIAPIATVRSDRASWELATLDLWPRLMKRLDWGRIKTKARSFGVRALDGVRAASGTVRICFTDDAGDQAHCVITIAGGGGPEASVHADEADLWALVAAQTGWTQLLRSRARIDGDAGYLVRLLRELGGR